MKQSTKTNFITTEGFHMLFYRAALPLSSRTLAYVSGIIRRGIGSRWRALNPGGQALLVLVYLKKDEIYDQVAAGFDVSTTTAWRYVDETARHEVAHYERVRGLEVGPLRIDSVAPG